MKDADARQMKLIPIQAGVLTALRKSSRKFFNGASFGRFRELTRMKSLFRPGQF
jgi:hypothetical protein